MDPTDAFSLLANQVRRVILTELEFDETVCVDDLARDLADHPQVDAIWAPDQARIRLVHVDLPMLAEHDAIVYERDTARVALTETGQHLQEVLRVAREVVGAVH